MQNLSNADVIPECWESAGYCTTIISAAQCLKKIKVHIQNILQTFFKFVNQHQRSKLFSYLQFHTTFFSTKCFADTKENANLFSKYKFSKEKKIQVMSLIRLSVSFVKLMHKHSPNLLLVHLVQLFCLGFTLNGRFTSHCFCFKITLKCTLFPSAKVTECVL